MPKYKMIAKDLRTKIISGVYAKDDQLPKQIELAAHYHTSRVTIQKALELLHIEGITYARKGIGTFVKDPLSLYDYNANIFLGTSKRLAKYGKITSKIISFEVLFPEENEREKLRLKKNDPIYDIVRLRLLDGVPLVLEYTIMPVYVIPGITEDILKSSVYTYISEKLKLSIGSPVRRIKADKPDKYDQKYLQCQSDDPVMELEQLAFLHDGRPFEFSQSRHRYDKGDFIVANMDMLSM